MVTGWRETALGELLLNYLTERSAKALVAWLQAIPEEEREARVEAAIEFARRDEWRRKVHRERVARWRAKQRGEG